MRRKRKEVLLVLLLGVVIPSLFLAVSSKGVSRPSEQQENQSQSQPTQTAEDEELKIPVMMQDGSICKISIQEYIVSVVLKEMPADFEKEALKAQAVVARTYALRSWQYADKHTGAAVCTEASCCQGFCTVGQYLADGGKQTDVDKITHAVYETANEVLTYNGELIEATYFSCSGGQTEDAAAVWGSDIPYLQAVKSPGEEGAAHFTDTVTFTAKELSALLGETFSGKPATWVKSVTYTHGGGVDTMQIGHITYKGTTLRQKLGLRSTAFMMTAIGDRIIITTKGFGHRVGMSQYGADAMAASGKDYLQILAHYYQGTQIETFAL